AIASFGRERGSRCASTGLRRLDGPLVDVAPGGEVAFQLQGVLFANAAGMLEYSVTATPRSAGEELDPSDNGASDADPLVPAPDLALQKSDGLAQVVAGTAATWRIDLANAGVSDAIGALLDDPAPLFPASSAGLLAGSGSWTCAANLPLDPGTATAGAALAGVGRLAVAPDGSRLYAVNPAGNTLLSYPRAGNGSLGTPLVVTHGSPLGEGKVTGMDLPTGLALAPDGSQVFVTGAASNSLAVFAVGAGGALSQTQVLASVSGGVVGMFGAADVVASADGRFVFVAAPTSHAIAVFRRDPATGVLAFVERVADGLGT